MREGCTKTPTVLVGMSGGVDSSVAAALLQKQGFTVVGGFIKNWSDSKDLWTGECQWKGERRDALRVASRLGIPLLTFDFEETYRKAVVDDLFRGYAAGETPNPDVLCNEFIKFGLFFEEAKRLGFDFVATGHYARVGQSSHGEARLLRGIDPMKDQSYFLYRVPQDVLRRTLMPIGGYHKSDIREFARTFNLPVADKPDSQGICFIGKLDMAEFLRKKISSKPGDIVDEWGNILGQHGGLDAYTIGQRHGIHVSAGEEPWYVARKDVASNRLIVVSGADHPMLFSTDASLRDLRWIKGEAPAASFSCEVQIRYRQTPTKAMADFDAHGLLHLRFAEPVKALASGQSAVLYQRDECLGGGIIVLT